MVLNTEITIPELKMNDGHTLPAIGLGIGIIDYPNYSNLIGRAYQKYIQHKLISMKCQKSIESAIEIGYRLIDTSAAYNNLSEIANVIRHYIRADIKLQSRVSNRAQFSNSVKDEFYRSLDSLKCDYIDILQIHWPVTNLYLKTWEEMMELKQEGLVKSVGVANFNVKHIENLISASNTVPAVNQIEIHPLFSNKEVIKFSQSLGVLVQAYSPLARMDDRLLKSGKLRKIANCHNTTIPSVILRWQYQNKVIPIVKSRNSVRQKENLSIFNFELDEFEMSLVDSININARRRFDPDNCEFENL